MKSFYTLRAVAALGAFLVFLLEPGLRLAAELTAARRGAKLDRSSRRGATKDR